MKINDIEKDIHLLESYSGMTHKMTDNQGRPKLDQAIEHVLLDYKRLQKENEIFKKVQHEWSKAYQEERDKNFDLIMKIKNDYIPIQEVKDKIAEIKNEKLGYSEDEWYIENEIKGYAIDKLKEIIEEGDNND